MSTDSSPTAAERRTVGVEFGALADPIGQQLHDQGLDLPAKESDHIQKDADSITRLHVRGLLPEAQVRAARKRLLGKVRAALEQRTGSER